MRVNHGRARYSGIWARFAAKGQEPPRVGDWFLVALVSYGGRPSAHRATHCRSPRHGASAEGPRNPLEGDGREHVGCPKDTLATRNKSETSRRPQGLAAGKINNEAIRSGDSSSPTRPALLAPVVLKFSFHRWRAEFLILSPFLRLAVSWRDYQPTLL